MKSTGLDAWNKEWIEHMDRIGNVRANRFWEFNMRNDQRRPSKEEANAQDPILERFIRDKYERRAWEWRDGQDGEPQTLE